MTEPITICVHATAPQALNPNSGTHPRSKQRHTNKLRDIATLETGSHLQGMPWQHGGPIALEINVYWERRRRTVDTDNGIAMQKALIDGVFHHLDANDRQVHTIRLNQHRDPAGLGFTLITVIPLEQEKAA